MSNFGIHGVRKFHCTIGRALPEAQSEHARNRSTRRVARQLLVVRLAGHPFSRSLLSDLSRMQYMMSGSHPEQLIHHSTADARCRQKEGRYAAFCGSLKREGSEPPRSCRHRCHLPGILIMKAKAMRLSAAALFSML